MSKMISVCGLDCSVCPAHVALLTNDQALREKTAVEWSKAFHAEITADMINCVGCTAVEGVHKVANCGECADYGCATIAGFMDNVPPAKANLEEVRAARKR